MDNIKCAKIVEFFELFYNRPVMITGKSYDFEWTIQFIKGFYLALEITGEAAPSREEVRNAYLDRGWKESYFGAIEEMKSKGLDGDEITREIVAVEIELWKAHSTRFV